MKTQRSSLFLAETDRAAIRTVCERYGLATESDALRLAVRVLAASPLLTLPADWRPPPTWSRKPKSNQPRR